MAKSQSVRCVRSVIIVVLALTACSRPAPATVYVENDPVGDSLSVTTTGTTSRPVESETVETDTGITSPLVVGVPSQETEDPGSNSVDRPPPSYLEEVIPPCIPVTGTQRDPCAPGTPPIVAVMSVHTTPPSWPFDGTLPTLLETLSGIRGWRSGAPNFTPHIVVRATGLPDTTRCALYRITLDDLTEGLLGYGIAYHYHCFVDFRINEYIVGTGPGQFTVSMHREMLYLEHLEDWADIRDEWLSDVAMNPQARTATAYEGNELVMFLGYAKTQALEAWSANWLVGDLWSVQRGDDGAVTAVATDFVLAYTEEDRNRLDMPLADLITKVKAAAATRNTAFGGRVGAAADLPMLVTDANELDDFYIEVGAVYEGENATTVLPPPLPPGVPTNVGLSTNADGTIFVTWDPPTSGGPVEDYYVWLSSDLGNNRTTSFYDVESLNGEEFFQITGMVRLFGDEFTVQVRAGNVDAYSDWTETQTFANPTTSTTSTTSTSSTTSTTPTSSTTSTSSTILP